MSTQNAIAVFAGSDSVPVTWSTMGGGFGVVHGCGLLDTGGVVELYLTSVTSTGATLNASAPFVGTVMLTVLDAANVTAVTFTAADTAAATWTAIVGNFGITYGVAVTDGLGPLKISVSGVTSTGATVSASRSFTGTVYLYKWVHA